MRLSSGVLVIDTESACILHDVLESGQTGRLPLAAAGPPFHALHATKHVALRKPGSGMTQRRILGRVDRFALPVRTQKQSGIQPKK